MIWPDCAASRSSSTSRSSALLSQIFFMRGVELLGPGRAGLFVNLVPVFGAILGVAILGEPFRWYHAVGLAAGLRRHLACGGAKERALKSSFGVDPRSVEELIRRWLSIDRNRGFHRNATRARPIASDK